LKGNKDRHTLCWQCAKATGKCAWSKAFQPVPGWTAEPTVINNNALAGNGRFTPSYCVIECPEFEKG